MMKISPALPPAPPGPEASLWFLRLTLGGQALPGCLQPIMQIILLGKSQWELRAFISRRPCNHPSRKVN